MFVKKIKIEIWYFVIIVILVYLFWKFTKVMTLKYEFTGDMVIIHLSKRKAIRLNKKSIDKIEKINNIEAIKCFGIRYYPSLKENYFITHTKDVLKISTDNGDVFFISPRVYPQDILS